jgi:hypothetical protein
LLIFGRKRRREDDHRSAVTLSALKSSFSDLYRQRLDLIEKPAALATAGP